MRAPVKADLDVMLIDVDVVRHIHDIGEDMAFANLKCFLRRLKNLYRSVRNLESIVCDWYYNIHTVGNVDIAKEITIHKDPNCYTPLSYYSIWKITQRIHLSPEDVIYDIGCGKGRFCCYIARYPVKKVIGIDIVPELCEIAESNLVSVRKRISPYEIRNEDVAVGNLTEGTIYYLFNPFGEKTLRCFLDNLKSTYPDTQNHPIRIIYFNTTHANVFEDYPWLVIENEYFTLEKGRALIYRSQKAN